MSRSSAACTSPAPLRALGRGRSLTIADHTGRALPAAFATVLAALTIALRRSRSGRWLPGPALGLAGFIAGIADLYAESSPFAIGLFASIVLFIAAAIICIVATVGNHHKETPGWLPVVAMAATGGLLVYLPFLYW